MLGVIVVILMVTVLVMYWLIYSKGGDLITNYAEKYNNKILLNASTATELKNLLVSKNIENITNINVINDTSLEVSTSLGTYTFYIENNYLSAIFPERKIAGSVDDNRKEFLLFTFKINSKVKQTKEIAQIFDRLNDGESILPSETKTTFEGITSKIRIYWKLFIGSIIAIVLIFAIFALFDNNDSSSTTIDYDYYGIGDTIIFSQGDGSGEFELTFTEYGTGYEYGDAYTYIEYAVENTSSESVYFNDADINCYADGYAANTAYILNGEYNNNIALSPGRKATGKIYFDINANNVDSLELEFADSIWILK